MQSTSTASIGSRITINYDRLDQLRNAHGIGTDAELARVLQVDPATLYRVREGKTVPSNEFLAKVATAFPNVTLDQLFVIEGRRAVRRGRAA